jgi:hypothetical protein
VSPSGRWRRALNAFTSEPAPEPVATPAANPDQAWKALGLVVDWIKHAETKSAATLAAAGAVGTLLYYLIKNQNANNLYLNVLATTCAVLVVAAGVCATIALWPRLRSGDDPSSPLYFDHIARQHARHGGSKAYADALRALVLDNDQLIAEIAAQAWSNAHVARRKYKWGSAGLIAAMLSVFALGATALMVALDVL